MNFSLKYDNQYYTNDMLEKKSAEKSVIDGVAVQTEVYQLDSLLISRTLKEFDYGAKHSLFYIENTSSQSSKIISEIKDINNDFDIDVDDDVFVPGYNGYAKRRTFVYRTVGSNCSGDEYLPIPEVVGIGSRKYSCAGGRSSSGLAPFFEVNNGDGKGLLMAIGWTGQWTAEFARINKCVNVSAGIENVEFYLEPGEKIRTASILVMPYDCDRDMAHNQFKRIIKKHFSLIGNKGRSDIAPLSFQTWGGARSEFLIQQARKAGKENFGFEYFWVDAGWYGNYEGYCKSEHTGIWAEYTGDWFANKRVHPNEMRDVMSVALENGMKPLLWFEIERVVKGTKVAKEHPEWLLKGIAEDSYILNLGMEEAKQWMIDTLSHFVEELNLHCYRQDFNFEPLYNWNNNDVENRKGISQIKHIMGMYHVWDTLLEKYPHLIIDNCSSGGRRIDIETNSRSIPLWRSDAQCAFDYHAIHSQDQNIGLSRWIPYSGCGVSLPVNDQYQFRSCYSSALSTNFWGYEEFEDLPLDTEKVRKYVAEYKSVRKYFSCDFYPVFGFPIESTTSFAGWQFNNPEDCDGIVMAFRRDECLSDNATITLGGLEPVADYEFTDVDTGTKMVYSSEKLLKNGFKIEINKKRSSKLYKYKKL